MKFELIDLYDVEHEAVIITIQKRVDRWGNLIDYGYTTSKGIMGIGQSSTHEAKTCAKQAIDKQKGDLC